jgi:maltose alpha-D-glucosyltransferase/alpha-amylase
MDRDEQFEQAARGKSLPSPLRPPLWFKDVVIYEAHVRAFFDSDNDGVGDFPGMTAKLDYIADLGVDAIWLLPFYPSPGKDDGYDIADYHGVHPQYGTMHDFRTFVREAHRRGLRVITELVVNHTSDQHAWFQAARRAAPGSSKRDYYVWSDSPDRYTGTRIIFTDTETSNWAWDPVANAYYWHRFFSHQPDLNFDNPHVLKAVIRTMRYWLDMGVDGLRLDAIPYLIERDGTSNENLPETHAVVKEIRRALDEHYGDRMLLAEANMWPEDVRDYFADGDECHMAYHFPLMPRIYMAIAQEERHPIVEIMQQTPDIPDACQWAIFLRNHDELTLEMVTSRERDYMYRMYAADARARINLGIRRRLAPLMENDSDRIKLVNSLLLSMPGSPIIYYGDEIGMGDNIFLGDRNGVRTPMQWSPDRNAGFSRADPQRLYSPPIMDPIYGYEAVNVEAQARDASSLLNWMKRMLAVRKTTRAFGRGTLHFLKPGNRKVLAYLREHGGDAILCVANLARTAQPVELDLTKYKGRVPVELLGRTTFPPVGDLPYLLTLPSHGFYWFRLAIDAEMPGWHEERLPPEDLPVLVLFDGWNSFFRDRVVPWRIGMAERVRNTLERETLPRFLLRQRWYGGKGDVIANAAILDHAQLPTARGTALLTLLQVESASGQLAAYFVPLALAWEDGDEERVRALNPVTVARIRQQATPGVLADAFADEGFCRALVQAIGENRALPTVNGTIRFSRTQAFDAGGATALADLPVHVPKALSTNTVVSLGQRFFLKGYRRLRAGVNPELEVGRYLTEVAPFPNTVPLAGAVEYVGNDGSVRTLAVLQGYVENQGDGWSYTLDYLERFLEAQRTATEPPDADAHGAYLALMQTLGMRTAQMHVALATRSGDTAFDPEPVQPADLEAWKARVVQEARQSFDLLAQRLSGVVDGARGLCESLLAQRERAMQRIDAITPRDAEALKTRYHGDYHLGQVLLSRNDFVISDFEGEPGRTLEERRAKQSPLRDVAGMLRSFDYAQSSALVNTTTGRPEDLPRLEPLARRWDTEARRAFLTAYEQTVRGGVLFRSFAEMQGLLALFELEKAFYELRYELDNRPDWVAIPVRGILRLVEAE